MTDDERDNLEREISDLRGQFRIPKWTRDENASAVLLEEMPYPRLHKDDDSPWWYCSADKYRYPPDANPERMVAIALAWLKWRKSR